MELILENDMHPKVHSLTDFNNLLQVSVQLTCLNFLVTTQITILIKIDCIIDEMDSLLT